MSKFTVFFEHSSGTCQRTFTSISRADKKIVDNLWVKWTEKCGFLAKTYLIFFQDFVVTSPCNR